jgi:gliding motility-associated-like protein
MKKLFGVFVFLLPFLNSFATHIAAGELYYTYQGPGAAANTSRYLITMKLFRECASAGQDLNTETVQIGIYNNPNLTLNQTLTLVRTWSGTVPQIQNVPGANPCLIPPISLCYQVGTYSATVDLANLSGGYTLSWVRYSRMTLTNVTGNCVGATFVTRIPGTTLLPSGSNSSAQFVTKDTSTVCNLNGFTIDFSATDQDGDSLVYRFTDAYDGFAGDCAANPRPTPGATLSLPSVNYIAPFSGGSPLGAAVTINSRTGIISGIAPAAGRYVICVIAEEWRGGARINEHRKDFILNVGDCSLSGAKLRPNYITCDGYTMSFSNESSSAGIISYTWNFGDPKSGVKNTSDTATPTHTYSDSGVYVLKLVVRSSGGCSDSATALVKVFPGFIPDFNVIGSCFQTPFQFRDATTTQYGVVDSWRWNFGDLATDADTSLVKNPTYKYPDAGSRTVELIVTNSKGCVDTISKDVTVFDVPALYLPFKDTLICAHDTLPLIAQGTGTFTWTPNYNIINSNSSNPLVYPYDTTKYIVTINENGCIKKDTITVNVLDFITVDLGPDTVICKTDTITLRPASHALSYRWTPTTYLNNPNIKFPVAKPDTSIKYLVEANLGHCPAKDSFTVFVAPYPKATVGPDVEICYGTRTLLTGTIVGSVFTWSPSASLINASTLTPLAGPTKTTSYILTVYDTLGCPKPGRDTVIVKVISQVKAFAGRDTLIVATQPLQLNASGGTSYLWTPTTGMNNPNIYNPVVVLGPSVDSITYFVRVTTPEGCFADDDIKVRVFKTLPDIFVPSAFTPNSDGKNDIIRPIPVGIKSFHYFRVFNRWGQMVYSTNDIGIGWDGMYAGKEQGTGTYVYMAEAEDYLGNILFRKGTVVLIR